VRISLITFAAIPIDIHAHFAHTSRRHLTRDLGDRIRSEVPRCRGELLHTGGKSLAGSNMLDCIHALVITELENWQEAMVEIALRRGVAFSHSG
jgi:hypothetical protein